MIFEKRSVREIPRLESPRLILRAMQPSDAADMYAYACDREVTRYLLWEAHENIGVTRAYLDYIARRYRRGECLDFAIELKSERRMIGTAGFVTIDGANRCAEIGYVVNPDYQNKGIATEAARELLAYAFDKLNMNRVEARFMKENERSLRVMEKLSMSFEGIAREKIFVKGMMRDVGTCAILREEYYENNEKRYY